MEPKIYHIDGREIHQFGFYVSVVWNTKIVSIQQGNGLTLIPQRYGTPYIAFYWIRGDEGDEWLDEDSTLDSGLTAEQAEEVTQGLLAAAAYLRKEVG